MLPDPSDCNIVYFDEIDSTNAYAIREFDSLPDGTIVAAACQSAGRGRLGNQWVSEKGKGIYMTLVMKNVTDPFKATTAVSLGVLDALRKAAEKAGIALQEELCPDRTSDAGQIQLSAAGIPTAILALPVRGLGSALQSADLRDARAALQVLRKMV